MTAQQAIVEFLYPAVFPVGSQMVLGHKRFERSP